MQSGVSALLHVHVKFALFAVSHSPKYIAKVGNTNFYYMDTVICCVGQIYWDSDEQVRTFYTRAQRMSRRGLKDKGTFRKCLHCFIQFTTFDSLADALTFNISSNYGTAITCRICCSRGSVSGTVSAGRTRMLVAEALLPETRHFGRLLDSVG